MLVNPALAKNELPWRSLERGLTILTGIAPVAGGAAHFTPAACAGSAVRICPVVPTPTRAGVAAALAARRSPLVVITDLGMAPSARGVTASTPSSRRFRLAALSGVTPSTNVTGVYASGPPHLHTSG